MWTSGKLIEYILTLAKFIKALITKFALPSPITQIVFGLMFSFRIFKMNRCLIILIFNPTLIRLLIIKSFFKFSVLKILKP
jgi:hypothetical protein